MKNKIIDRIIQKVKLPGLIEALSHRISFSDLQSLLIEIYDNRIKKLAPKDVINQYCKNRFVCTSDLSPLVKNEFEQLAYSFLPDGFEAVELSPVCPLGTNSVVASVSQNNTVTTIRNTEVCSDSTNALALECACRRREIMREKSRSASGVKLCSSHRLLRTQLFDGPASFAHFLVFSLCTAGRDSGSFNFETINLKEHIDFYIKLLTKGGMFSFSASDIRVFITVINRHLSNRLQTEVVDTLAGKYNNIKITFDPDRKNGIGYYTDACFQIFARDLKGTDYMLVDGGFTNWTQKYLNSRKERLLTSGIGSERFCLFFRT